MATDTTTLLALVAGPVLTATVTVWVPAWLQRRTERERFEIEQIRLEAESERVRAERRATAVEERRQQTLNL